MQNVLLVAYLLIVIAMIAVILLQRSEGGALGIGGGGGGGFMTARGSANLLTRTTAVLATLFFATAIGLTVLSELDRPTSGILDFADDTGEGVDGNVLDALNRLQEQTAPATGDPGLALPDDATTTTDTNAPTIDPLTDATAPAGDAAPGTVESDPGLAVPTETPAETPTDQPATPAPN
jgi:preprotein translocase subunit SecG